MRSFQLTKHAEDDLLNIWRYSSENWSDNQADQYLDQLDFACEQIGSGETKGNRLPEIHPRLLFIHCNRHYIFWMSQTAQSPIVVAFLHDRMDFVRHLSKRLPAE